VNQETLFSLEELAHSDVFNVKSDWSDNITSLRQLAVQKPQVISEAFIFQHFTTLRLVDRNVSTISITWKCNNVCVPIVPALLVCVISFSVEVFSTKLFLFNESTFLSFQINEVDRGLLKFTNLQELSFTGNCLTSVVGAHLPKSLTVIVNTIQRYSFYILIICKHLFYMILKSRRKSSVEVFVCLFVNGAYLPYRSMWHDNIIIMGSYNI